MKYHDQKSNVEGIFPREKEGNGRVMSTCHAASLLQTIRAEGMDRPRRPGPS